MTQEDAVIAAIAGLGKSTLGKGVCAVDLAGTEALYPTADFADIFAYDFE